MATTAITAEHLVVNARSADLSGVGSGSGNGIVATTPADGWVISPGDGQTLDERLILQFTADGTGDTVTIVEGTQVPAQRANLGNITMVLAASDSRFICIETSRFLRTDGTILATATDAGTVCTAIILSKGP